MSIEPASEIVDNVEPAGETVDAVVVEPVSEIVDVIVVGGGPAGLACATTLAATGVGRVVVVERETEAGGVPRYTSHRAFGLRDEHRSLSGPAYAKRLVERARRAGAEVRTSTTVVDVVAERTAGPSHVRLHLHDHLGVTIVASRAVVLATGTRERGRNARLVPGSRPAGVLTTSAVQQLAVRNLPIGRRAVIVGAEHVSFSAVATLADAGCDTVALVTEHPMHETYGAFARWTARRHHVAVLTGDRVDRIDGRHRVESVTLASGRALACDTVVFTGGWVAEHTVARRAGVTIDRRSGSPSVDGALRTDVPGVFAAGNLVHGALQADWCALDGRHVASGVTRWLTDGSWPTGAPIEPLAPLAWTAPHRVSRDALPPHGRLVVAARWPSATADIDPVGRTGAPAARSTPTRLGVARHPAIEVRQGGELLWRGRPRTPVVPGRPFTIATTWWATVDVNGPSVVVALA